LTRDWAAAFAAHLPYRLAAILLALAALALAGPMALAGARIPATPPSLKLAPRPAADPPMRILRVRSADPACEPNCPEWIAAQGKIMPGAAAAFAKIVGDLNGRRLPVLISSPGGSLPDAVAIGKLVREKKLAVAVARTLVSNCPERAKSCPNAKGKAIVGGARCASACPLILAGGVERLVGPAPLIGVHQITLSMKETEGAVHLTRIRKVYEPIGADEEVEAYLKSMGIGEPVMTLLRKTPAPSIRWLSLPELLSSRLATLSLDAAAPIATGGANGLTGHGFEGGPMGNADLAAHGEAPGGALDARLAYARGGGVVEIALAARPRSTATPSGVTLKLGGQSLALEPGATATIARERFCAGARAGQMVLAVEGGAGGAAPAGLDLARMDGATALIDEACGGS